MRRTETFYVESPTGLRYEVTEIRERKVAASLNDRVSYEGLVSYRLRNGLFLNKTGVNTFQIPGDQEVLTRV